MPQLTLEYTSNIFEKNDIQSLFKKIHHALTEMLPTEISQCKSKAIECTDFFIGDGDKKGAFVHVTLNIKSGRTQQTQETVTAAIMQILKNHFNKSLRELQLQITLELHDLPPIYLKITH